MTAFGTRIHARVVVCGVPACGILVFAVQCLAQTSSPWRFWDTSDGFVESYTSSMVSDAGGNV